MAKKEKMSKMAAKYAERAAYFNKHKGAWNELTPEGRKRSGLGFSYATQKYYPRKRGHDIAGVKRSAKELRERGL